MIRLSRFVVGMWWFVIAAALCTVGWGEPSGVESTPTPKAEASGSFFPVPSSTALFAVRSLDEEYTVAQQITDRYYELMPGNADRSFRNMTFAYHTVAKGDFWMFDFLQKKGNGAVVFSKRLAFNGLLHQQLNREPGSNVMAISKVALEANDNTLCDADMLCLLYSFLRTEDGKIAKPLYFLKQITSMSLWEEREKDLKVLGKEDRNGHPCLSVEIPGGQSFDYNCPIHYRIWFALDLPGIPLHWDMMDTDGNILRSLDVSEVRTSGMAGSKVPFPYPGKMRFTHYAYADPKSRGGPTSAIVIKDYEMKSVVINNISSEEMFTIDPALAEVVYDVDSNRNIFVRPAKQ